MDREVLLAGLLLLVCGPLLLAGGLSVGNGKAVGFARCARARLWRGRRGHRTAARTGAPAARSSTPPPPACTPGALLERSRWLRMWVPCLPAMLAGALLVGWALQEPDASDEAIGPLGLAVMAPFALLWLRAAGRALRAWRSGARSGAASTSGLLRPRVSVDPAFAAKLDPEALAAVLAHERAHARHRDPLRIWLAQIATDLQGPWPAARARLAEWREALELARDDEARARGAEGAALAAGILAAVAEFSAASCESGAAVARIEGDPATSDHSERAEEPAPGESADRALRARIERLLTVDAPAPAPQRRLFGIGLVALLLFALAGAVGFFYGDAIVRALPGVIT